MSGRASAAVWALVAALLAFPLVAEAATRYIRGCGSGRFRRAGSTFISISARKRSRNGWPDRRGRGRQSGSAVGAAVGRVQIILVDQHDLSNGWATPLPYNTIEISAAAPPVESGIGNSADWLYLVFVHEYTHIAHLSRAGGWIRDCAVASAACRCSSPTSIQPIWGIEGWPPGRRAGRPTRDGCSPATSQ